MGLSKLLTGGLFEGLTKVASELITDKDKLAEFEYKAKELIHAADRELLQDDTIPWVDALVKLLLASKQFIRPVGSFFITAAGIYMHYKGVEVDAALHAVIDGAFPGWMYSRHNLTKRP